jgi:hypothetical protein
MSVLIKGMKMPSECRECKMMDYRTNTGRTWCFSAKILLADNYESIGFDGRHERCPLKEVKEPHGDLIDKEILMRFYDDRIPKLIKRYGSDSSEVGVARGSVHLLDIQPAVIETERVKE